MAEPQTKIFVRLSNVSLADQNRGVSELRKSIEDRLVERSALEQVTFEVSKARTDTQDLGATLVIVLGTPAAIAVAKGIHDFISKRGSRVVIETPEGSVIANGDGAENIDVAKTVEALKGKS
jgi:hypothetical protein